MQLSLTVFLCLVMKGVSNESCKITKYCCFTSVDNFQRIKDKQLLEDPEFSSWIERSTSPIKLIFHIHDLLNMLNKMTNVDLS